jgi:plastocyanin
VRTRIPATLVLLGLALLLASCGGDSGTDAGEATTTVTEEAGAGADGSGEAPGGRLERSVKVEIADFAYDPETVRVATGGKVIWQNMDSEPHTAAADDGSFDTGTIDEGKLKSETFKQAGTFAYHCRIHPQMHGTIEVVDQE